ncbi:MAG: SUMF1/EgtB/PvdO family nonheme iron enzyme, partial [Candidatus Cloacimonetes bacterium]|nr:SUMF1/EgtB/PvdO family nonheme iron enzyme [Candidatus Cloacimonadota bacterium]
YKDLGVNPANWTEGWNALGADPNAIICHWEASGYRLPTEMEWMFAAKGGNLSLGYQYSGADSIYTVGWYSGNSGYTVHQVAGRVPNELGIFDLSGNLWEWCWDIYGAYPAANQNNPHGASNGSNKVLRGGCWSSSAASCQISERYQSAPSQSQAAGFGFRCVKKAP